MLISGVTKFWTDDYKVFDQIYGKTSDKNIYGSTLPLSVYHGVDSSKFKIQDSVTVKNKPEKTSEEIDSSASGSQLDPYGFGDNLSQHLRQRLKYTKEVAKPTKENNDIIYKLYKPIREETDPETYDYLKHLEMLEKHRSVNFPLQVTAGFKPYSNKHVNEENTYRSIQDILKAQDNSQIKPNYVEDDVKYVNYPNADNSRDKKKNIRLIQSNKLSRNGSKCSTGHGGCRKRFNYNIRYRKPRPVIRTIKHTIVSK